MTDWFRSWHGAPTDPKWVLIARKAGVTPAVASAIAWALFDHASQAHQRGSVAKFDCEVYAAWGALEDEAVAGVLKAMKDRGMIDAEDKLSSWSKRQPEREDGSAERSKAWRERNRTQASAVKHLSESATANDQQREDTELETEKEREKNRARGFSQFWDLWEHRVNRDAAEKAFLSAEASPEEIISGARRYIASRFVGQQWPDPTKWLQAKRWLDEYAAQTAAKGRSPGATVSAKRNIPGKFYALQHSPQGQAWDTHDRRSKVTHPWDGDGGWWFESEWPPGHGPPIATAAE